MKKIFCFGDIHLSGINSWNYEAGNHFIQWFSQKEFGNRDEIEVAFAGDIAERDTNPGNVIEQMDRLFNMASQKFSSVYVCVGNHDLKKYHDVEQHSLKFLTNKPNVHVIEKESSIVTPNGFSILFLPHRSVENMTLWDYYNTMLPREFYSNEYDILMGHLTIKEEKGMAWMKQGLDISLFHAKMYAMGHIHTRDREEYIGSVFPNKVDEMEFSPRRYKILDEMRNESSEKMPPFLEFVTIKYGDPVPERKPNCAYVYTVSECDSRAQVDEKYSDIQVRTIERKSSLANGKLQLGTDKKEGNMNILTGNIVDAFNEMIKDDKLKLNRKTYNLVINMLEKK